MRGHVSGRPMAHGGQVGGGGVDMHMGIAQPWHDYPSTDVDDGRVCLGLALGDGGNPAVCDQNMSIVQ